MTQTHSNLFDLTGKTALVTGGGSGLGRAMAHALSDAGADLILVGRRGAELEASLTGRVGRAMSLDLLRDDAARELAGCGADILVNAAGINPRAPADTISPVDWDRTIRLNLTVPFFMAQALAPGMKARGWGRIINIASLQSERAFENGIAYGASKGGVMQLTRAMAEAWSGAGITANALAPGFFPTDLTAPVFGNADLAARNAAQTAIGRNGDLADIAGPVVFLASDASRYVTGQTLYVDGGYTAK